MAFTTINKSSLYQNQILYTGDTSSSRSITGVGFQPDLVWVKTRNASNPHLLSDVVRGTNNNLQTNSNSVASTSYSQGWVSAFGADGYTAQAGSGGDNDINGNTNTYVAWNWKANGAGSANADGSITTTSTSVDTTAKFSISKWTGDGTGGSSIGHGLGVKPEFVIIKRLEGAQSWYVWNQYLGDNYLELDTTTTSASGGLTVTASTITFPNSWSIYNASGEAMICYAFAPVLGYSKFGGYTGNSETNGVFVYTGFKPTWVMLKRTDSADWWGMYDSTRNPSNVVGERLYAQASDTEANVTNLDFLSNGFKLRSTDGAINNSGGTYIYAAFGQTVVGTNDTPATAR